MAAAAVALSLAIAGARAATIQTDLWVYNAGDTVNVTGDGFAPAETVSFTTTDPLGSIVDMGTAVADSTGDVAYSFVLPAGEPGDYLVSAVGLQSGQTATTTFDPPGPPSALRFTDSRDAGGGIVLNWTGGSPGAQCYYVYRSTTAAPVKLNGTSCSTAPTAPLGTTVSIVQSTSTTLTDSTAATGTRYWYGVTGVSQTGSNAGESGFSNVVDTATATTSPTSFAFASTAVGSSASRSFTFTNASSTAVTFQGISITGTNATDFSVATTETTNQSIPASGSFTFTVTFAPAAGAASRTASVQTLVRDSGQTGNNAHLTGVTGTVNSPPTCSAVTRSVNEDATAPVTLSCTDPNAGDTFTYAFGQPAHGTVTGTAPNVTYTPAANYNGADSFTYTATDNHGSTSAPATVSLTVVPVNDAPTATAGTATTNEDTAASINLSTLASDRETTPSSALTYAIATGPAHGVATVGAGGVVTYTPALNYSGPDSFSYQVTDTGDPAGCTTASSTCDPARLTASATVSLTVVPVNDAPTAGAGSATTNEDTPTTVNLSALASDVETPSASLTYTIVSNAAHGSVSLGAGGAATYTPAANFHGSDSFTYKVTDSGDGASAPLSSNTATISLTVNAVNDAPIAGTTSALTNEDTASAPIDVKPVVSDVETAVSALTYAIGTQPAHGSVVLGATAGTFVYTPAPNYNGPDSFTYTVRDTGDPAGCSGAPPACSAALTSAPGTVSLSVIPVNDAPVATNGSATATEDTAASVDLTQFASDQETPSSALTYTIVSGPSHGTAVVGAGGIVTYTPAANYNGADSFTYKATDNDPTPLSSATRTISLTVNPVNDAPTAGPASGSATEDGSASIDLRSAASDVETAASALTYTVVNGPAHGSVAPAATNGILVYTPAANFNGTDTFTYRVTDTGDGASAPLSSNTATVSLTVSPVNDAPSATDGTASTNEDATASIDLSPFASDVETSSAALTYAIVSGPAHGSAAVGSAGIVTYTPDPNFNGNDAFSYRVTDTGDPAGSSNVLSSATKTISLTVNPVNDAPTAGSASALTDEDTAKTIDLRPTASDLETPTSALAFAIAAQPSHGSIAAGAQSGTFVYTPDANYSGPDSFTYTATDTGDPAGCSGSAPSCSAPRTSTAATVTLTVLPVNDAPVGHDYSVPVSSPLGIAINLATATAPDATPLVHDVETSNANLTYTLVGVPSQGTLTAGSTPGAFTYVPRGTASGSDTATYTVTDRGDPDNCGTAGASCSAAKTSATYTITFQIASTLAPPVTSGLELLFDADSVAQSNGAAVSVWKDGSGNGRDLSAAPGGEALLRAGAVNGHAAVEFDGVRSLMKTYGSSFTISQPDTFYIVYRSADPASDEARGFVFDSSNSSQRQAFGRQSADTQRMYANIDLDAADVTFPFAGYEIWSGAFNGSNSAMFENGTQIATGNAGGSALTGLTVGGLSTDNTLGYDRGHSYIAAFLVYSGSQTAAQRSAITNWLNDKYGVIGSPTPPTSTSLPTLDGLALTGATLTATKGTWAGTVPNRYVYEIRRCDTAGNNCVAVGSSKEYTVASADAGSTLRVAVTATNIAGSSTAVSAPTAVVKEPTLLGNDAPPYTSGMQLWYDASDESYLEGAPVTTFHDLSGYGRDLTNFYPDNADAPTYRAGAINGFGAVEFDGVRSLLKTYGSTFSLTQPDTFFIVYKQLDTREAYAFDSTDSANRQLFGRSPASDMEMYANNEIHAPATYPFEKFQVWSGTYAGAASTLRQNGAPVGSGNAGGSALRGFTLGGLNSGSSFGYNLSHSLVAEVLWYKGALTSSQQQSIETWLLDKYGLGKPTATLNAPTTTVQGSATTISLANPQSSSSSPLHYAFSCNGSSLAGVTYATAGTASSTTCTFTDVTTPHTVVARVIDSTDQFSEYSQTITVTAAVPSATFVAPATVNEGSAIHLALNNPASTSTGATPYSYAFDCGSGTFGSFSATASVDCPTTNSGSAVVRGTIQDTFGNTAAYTATVTIANVAPTATLVNGGPVAEGSPVTISFVNVFDPSPADAVALTFSIACDGSHFAAVTSCTFGDNGTYHVVGRVTDPDGASTTPATDVVVTNVAPTATFAATPTVAEGSSATLSFTNSFDPSGADTAAGLKYAFACDGLHFGAAGGSPTTTCAFPTPGIFPVAGRISDKDGGSTPYDAQVVVANVAPTVTAAATQSVDEGSAKAFDLGSFTDPGANDGPWTVDVAWGDGQTSSFTSPQGALSRSHTYADNGTYSVQVTVRDTLGASDTKSFTANVANVAPTATFSATSPIAEGGTTTLSLTNATDASSVDVLTKTYSCDGVTFTATATCAFADNGTYTVYGKIADDDLGATTYPATVVVSNVAPTVTPAAAGQSGFEGTSATWSLGSFTDPGAADGPWAVAVNWGDGSTSTFNAAARGALASGHTFADDGIYTVSVTVTDKDHATSVSQSFTITIANVRPSVTAPLAQVATEGTAQAFSLGSFTDPGALDGPWSVTVAWGDGSATTTFNPTTTGILTAAQHTYADNGPYTVSVTVADSDGTSGSASFSVSVANAAPAVTAPVPQPATEGAATLLPLGSFTDLGVRDAPWAVDVNWGDGSVHASFASSVQGSLGTGTHTYADNGSYSVTISVTDKDGAKGTATYVVSVANVAPTGTLTQVGTAVEGSNATVAFSEQSDPSSTDTAAGFMYRYDCGSGYGAWVSTASTTCPFADSGAFVVYGQIRDKDLSASTSAATVTVTNVAPTAAVSNNGPIDEGGTAHITLTGATDVSPADRAAGFTYAFACDNGALVASATAATDCTFTDNGSFTVKARITDKDGGYTDYPTTVVVRNVAPTATFSAGGPVVEGGSVTLSLTNRFDPSPIDATSLTASYSCSASAAFVASATCTFPDNGTYTVRGQIADKDGGSTIYSGSVTVTNATPTLTAAAAQAATEGTAKTFPLGTFADAGTADSPWTVSVNWGDGTASSSFSATATGAISAAHTYADNGAFTVTTTVTDKDGAASAPATYTVTVANAAPTVAAGATQAANEGSATAFDLGSFGDLGANDGAWAIDVNWGDGTAHTTFTAASRGAVGTKSHTYDDNGADTVTVSVTDKDGASTSATFTVNVANVAPTATFNAPASVNEGSPIALSLTSPIEPSNADRPGLTYAFDCGTGSGYGAFGATASATCSTSDNGSRTVKGKIKDKDGGVSEYTATVAIANVVPSLSTPGGQPASEGQSAAIALGTFTDPGADSPWTVDVNWGDGSAHATATATATGSLGSSSHTYVDSGAYTVTVTVTDKDGGAGTQTFGVTVANVAPTATFPTTASGYINNPIALAFTAPSDPSSTDTTAGFHYAFDCNNGSLATSTYATALAPASTTCSYATAGTYTVVARIIDKDGGYTEYTATVTVTNPPPTADFAATGNTTSINEATAAGTQYTYTGSISFGDASTTVAADCGTGNAIVTGSLAYTANASGARTGYSFKCVFVYTTPTTYTLHATATRGGTAGPTATLTVTIANVVPTVTISQPLNFTSYLLNSPVNFIANFRDVGTSDGPWTCVWDFGNGVTRTVTPTGTAQPYGCNTSYAYPAKGTFTATLTVTDKWGGVGTKSVTVIVS